MALYDMSCRAINGNTSPHGTGTPDSSQPGRRAAAWLFHPEGCGADERWTRLLEYRDALRRLAAAAGRRLDPARRAERHVAGEAGLPLNRTRTPQLAI